MGGDFRISGGAGGEEHKHVIVSAGGVGRAVIVGAEKVKLRIKIVPAVSVLSDHYLDLKCRTVAGRFVDTIGYAVVLGADYSRNVGCLKAIFKIVSLELMGGGNGHCADLV